VKFDLAIVTSNMPGCNHHGAIAGGLSNSAIPADPALLLNPAGILPALAPMKLQQDPAAGEPIMRRNWICIAFVAGLSLGSIALAGGPQQIGGDMGGDCCDECDPCAGGRHHHHHHCHLFGNNPDAGFNCGCNGSYKFPVPPLYTYHWPGMYSAQLMTDYHSPWRFPPLKPYVDEVPEVMGSTSSLRRVQQASAITPTARSLQPSSFSEHLEQSLR
jgi:hypothetical protein